MPPVIVGPRCNRRVTCDASPNNARSESFIAVNPLDPYNMVASSKRFTDPAHYGFSLAAYTTFDGGEVWTDTLLPIQPGWGGTTDPAIGWDNAGNVFIIALPFSVSPDPNDLARVQDLLGVVAYKSSDGGRTWGAPTTIHPATHDDKQWCAGDISPASPFFGHVYVTWDGGAGGVEFARTTDHGGSWTGTAGQAAGSLILPGAELSDISVAADGTVYVVAMAGTDIVMTTSPDGGDSFAAPTTIVSGLTPITGAPPGFDFPVLPGGVFRVLTLPTGCAGSGGTFVVAWADQQDGDTHIYMRRSTNHGASFSGPASGKRMLTGGVASAPGMHEFHPQLANTPDGEIGCAFYLFGPHDGGEFPQSLIDVVFAASTNNGSTFPNRVTVTDTPWDPTVDAPHSHGTPETFIGEYFGLDATKNGFFPLWTDTRTGVQEIYFSRLAVNPADVYIRDSSTDVGDVPSPGYHWEYPDLIVRRAADVDLTTGANFVNLDLLHDGVTDHFIYGRVHNRGPNTARNVRLSVVVGNYPSLVGLPGAEFRYPQDWYPRDWDTAALQSNHLDLGESPPVEIADGDVAYLGPVQWHAADIPVEGTWHPCLLIEARCDNDDSAGGASGCDVDGDPDPCVYGSYFWGDNNVTQRNLSYADVSSATAALIELPFVVGSVWSVAKYLDVIVDKGRELARVPMTLRMELLTVPTTPPARECPPGELVFVEGGRVVVRCGDCDVGELVTAPGTIWKAHCPPADRAPDIGHGAVKVGKTWNLHHPRSTVGFSVQPGELRKMTISFTAPSGLSKDRRPVVRIYQRNDKKLITGSVNLEVVP
jgi:hypothetical protein